MTNKPSLAVTIETFGAKFSFPYPAAVFGVGAMRVLSLLPPPAAHAAIRLVSRTMLIKKIREAIKG